jgi:hypothetical protein
VTLSSTFVFLVVGHRAANHPKPLMQVSDILHTFRIDASKIGCAEYLDWVSTYPANGDQQSQLAIDTLPVAHGGNP